MVADAPPAAAADTIGDSETTGSTSPGADAARGDSAGANATRKSNDSASWISETDRTATGGARVRVRCAFADLARALTLRAYAASLVVVVTCTIGTRIIIVVVRRRRLGIAVVGFAAGQVQGQGLSRQIRHRGRLEKARRCRACQAHVCIFVMMMVVDLVAVGSIRYLAADLDAARWRLPTTPRRVSTSSRSRRSTASPRRAMRDDECAK